MTKDMNPWTKAQETAGKKVADNWAGFAKKQAGEPDAKRFQSIESTARVTEVQEKHEAELMAMDNVVGVACSHKMKGTTLKDVASLTVYVNEKKKTADLAKSATVPPEINGVQTDVVEVGDIRALAFNTSVRPALPGYSIGHYNITAGTFGALVRDVRRCCDHHHHHHDCCCGGGKDCDSDILILSNNHVLADVNKARPGDKILQPGPVDGGVFPSDTIATFERTEEIVFGANGYNLIDAALARPTDARNVTASFIGAAAPTGVGQALPLMNVLKVGRTTMVTAGVVQATNATVAVNFGADGVAVFRHQIITTAMSAGGDSGSLLMDFDLNGVGLLFAGSPFVTIHNHLLDVQNTLGVELVTTR
ncbi:MAG: hypothetical protein WBB85_06405 [Albidovulum sp.]|uniref:hypothetical protein n=1 Tax=Albidovulum sp. TaxID=1872424 RepID=UPI003CBA6F13